MDYALVNGFGFAAHAVGGIFSIHYIFRRFYVEKNVSNLMTLLAALLSELRCVLLQETIKN